MKRALLPVLLSIAIIAGIMTVVSCGESSSPTTPENGDTQANPSGAGVAVDIKDFTYIPETITVTVGTTVTWTNQDSARHTVTERNDMFGSDLLGKGESYSYTFNEKGEYEYYCIPHPYMIAYVIVE